MGMSYKWDPKGYKDNSAMQLSLAKEHLARLALKGNEKILDIGCGDGKITAEVARAVVDGYVVGIDSSSEMVSFSRESFSGQKNLRFELRDARELNFTNEFDVVFSNSALHWVKDHKPVLRGIKDALKPNGKFYLHMAGKGNAEKILKMADELVLSDKWHRYFLDFTFPWSFYGVEEYRAWILEAGLEPVHVELFPRDMTHKDRQGLYGWIKTTWLPYLERVPEEQQSDLINEILDKYVRHSPADSQGLIHLKLVRLVAEGVKR
jgi:trans-aconitate 2-methyltransferase